VYRWWTFTKNEFQSSFVWENYCEKHVGAGGIGNEQLANCQYAIGNWQRSTLLDIVISQYQVQQSMLNGEANLRIEY